MVLRDLTSEDVEPFVRAFVEDPPLSVDLGNDDDPGEAEALARLERQPGQRERGERVDLTIADRGDDRYLGEISLHHFHWHHRRAEVGFFVTRAERRRGVALEALHLATGWAFSDLGIERMALVTLPDNEPTKRLAERAGFSYEGTLRSYTLERGERKDNVVYSVLRSEWPA